jgi:NodT family efflux transporter outer membrane factor (OMF) lipoprotein
MESKIQGGKMHQELRRFRTVASVIAAMVIGINGCTSFHDYVHNGFKVGPNYCRPPAPVAEHWIDQADLRTEPCPEVLCHWWTVFNDQKLNELITCAYRQNLTLKEAGCRILQARASLGITTGEIFPQTQNAFGSYTRVASPVDPTSGATSANFGDQWNTGFSLRWELDFWGRFRRAILAAEDDLQASVYDYDGVLVTLLGDVATNYLTVRIDQERIRLLQFNVDHVQTEVWKRSRQRAGIDVETGKKLPGGSLITEADSEVAESTLKQTTASMTQLELDKRQAENQLCILLGMPPVDLRNMLGAGPIPAAPPEVVLAIPADLLRRRPDVRRAERVAASQSEQIGIAQAALYPAFSINGDFGYQARNFPDLFKPTSFQGGVGPSFQWQLLNYGRITNNVRLQDASFQELVLAYQQSVLQAQKEVENGLVTFLQAQRRTAQLLDALNAQAKAVDITKARYLHGYGGESSFSIYTQYEQTLLNVQDLSAQARGQIAQGLISVYRAMGGGWELRLNGGGEAGPMPAGVAPNQVEPILTPSPNAIGMPPVPDPPAAMPSAPVETKPDAKP